MRNIIVALALLGSLAFADSKTSIAVADLEARGMTKDDGGIISDRLREELLNTGVFRVMERSVMDQILKEQSFQQTGVCTGSDCQVQVGRMLGVDRLVIGSVGKLGTLYTLSIRMLNVETGEIEQSFSQDHQGAIEDLVRGPIRSVAAKLAWAISSKKAPQAAPAPQASLSDATPPPSAAQAPTPVAPQPKVATAPTPPPPQPQATSPVQPLEVGIRLHFNDTKISGNRFLEKLYGEGDGAFQIGGEIRINMNSVSIRTEILYTMRSLLAEMDDYEGLLGYDVKTETELSYLSVPLLLGFHFSPKFQVFAGPAMDFHLSDKTTMKMSGLGVDTTITIKDSDGYNTFYPSIIVGAGFRIQDFLIDFRYQIPLASAYEETIDDTDSDGNLTGTTTNAEMKISGWALSLGYLF